MTRKVVEFLDTNMGMVEDNLGQVGNNLEEAWGNKQISKHQLVL